MKNMLIKNIGELITPLGHGALHGAAMKKLYRYPQAAVYIEDGRISAVGPESTVRAQAPQAAEVLDAAGCCVLPGFVDPHTHLLFGGSRAEEFIDRLEGVPYLELLARGGGICSTMQATRQSSEAALYAQGKAVLQAMQRLGVTTAEGKSGYGLDRDTELRQLRVLRCLGRELPVTLKTTFLGAHALPPEYAGRPDEYVDFLAAEVLPLVAAEKLADFCDVFCETGVFTPAQAERLLNGYRWEAEGTSPDRNGVRVNVNSALQLNARWRMYAGYEFEGRSKATAHRFNAGVSYAY